MDLGESIRKAVAKLTNTTIIDAQAIKDFNRDLQKALISADVDVALVLNLTKNIEDKALHSKPPPGLSSKDYITNIVYDSLVEIMGNTYIPEIKPKKILLMGLYGSGKTTTAVKLAKFYQDRGLGAAVVCCDVSRPAAYEQLETLAKQAGVSFFGIKESKDPVEIIKKSASYLKDKDVVICDTSGRSALDQQLIAELKNVSSAFRPDESMLVISADIGRVVGKQAEEFDNAVKITGIIITKMDGSSKGGGALTAAAAAKASVKFIGNGEKIDDIEPYNSKKFVERLLGLPDIDALLNRVKLAISEAAVKPEDLEQQELNFETFYTQLKALNKMGPLKNVLGMLGAYDVPKEIVSSSEEKLNKYKVIISSMTMEERKDEKLLHNSSRIKRIALGSGVAETDVHQLISDFNKMKKIYSTFANDRSLKKKFSKFF
ncbi:MAG: signal recognition particle receptor subunit alpha [Candidatus Micrarchaeia archaeon]